MLTAVVTTLVVVVAALGGYALFASPSAKNSTTAWASGLTLAALAGAVLAFAPGAQPGVEAQQPGDATLGKRQDYASSKSCRTCHPGEYATWWGTYHRRMTQPIRDDNLVATFDGQPLVWEERTYRIFREQGRLMVDMPAFGEVGSREAERWVRPVVMTTGSHHMQAYWIWAGDEATNQEREGQALFGLFCASCHGPNGRGGSAVDLLGVGMVPEDLQPWLHEAEYGHPRERKLFDEERIKPARAMTDEERLAVFSFIRRIQFDGRLTQFPFVWLTEADRWIHEEVSFLQPPPPPTETEPPGDRWGQSCDECHAVGASYKFDVTTLSASSEAVDLGIACEACHGPGREHVEHHRNPFARYDDAAPADIINPRKLEKTAQLHVCGQCHAETESKSGPRSYTPGGDLEQDLYIVQHPQGGEVPDWLAEALEDEPDRLTGSFWEDGTVRVAGRDLNGLLASACTTKGSMTCLSCHQMHGSQPDAQLAPGMEGDKACLQCHQAIGDDVGAHTFHNPEGEGSRCYNCHMPYTTYGLLQAIRAHRVDSPDPLRSASTGRPDACTLCHLDKSLGWAERSWSRWRGREPRDLPDQEAKLPMSVLHLTRGDAIQRAVTAWHLRWPPARAASGDLVWSVPLVLPLLEDDYAAVRYLAGQALQTVPGFEELRYDFVALPPARAAFRQRAEAIWAALPDSVRGLTAQRLATSTEELDAVLLALLAERHDDGERINE